MKRLINPANGATRDFTDRQQTAYEVLLRAGWRPVAVQQASLEPEELLPEVEFQESGIPPASGPIVPLPKSMPGYKALVAAGVYTLDVLRGQSAKELASIPGIGNRTADKIITRVELYYANSRPA